MRIAVILIVLSFGVKADSLPELTSFYEINSAGEYLHGKRIEVVGFLSVMKFDGKSSIYLCPNRDSCFSVSKDRLIIHLSEDYSEDFVGNLEDYDQCHVSLNGVYKFEPSTIISRSLGQLTDVLSLSLAISRHDYSVFNGSCKVWNEISPKINETLESSKKFDERMSRR